MFKKLYDWIKDFIERGIDVIYDILYLEEHILYGQFLVDFMILKNEYTVRSTGESIIPLDDGLFIIRLPYRAMRYIVRELTHRVVHGSMLTDINICPHCLYANYEWIACGQCSYTRNNGRCHPWSVNNLYGRICDNLKSQEIHNSIVEIPGLKEDIIALVKKYDFKF